MIFDTSTLVSAAFQMNSAPQKALSLALPNWSLCVSEATMAELEEVLGRPKFDRYLSQRSRRVFLALIRRRSRSFLVSDSESAAVRSVCRDPQDSKFLALAIAARAEIIVSSDKDLLVLHPWRGIGIVTPAEFVSQG